MEQINLHTCIVWNSDYKKRNGEFEMAEKGRTGRYWFAFMILAALLLLLFVWNVNSGSIDLSVSEIMDIIFKREGEETAYNIIWEIRLPRIIAVVVLGGALSVSGFLLQTFFEIPLPVLLFWDFFRGKTGSFSGYDLLSEQIHCSEFRSHDRGSFCRINDIHGIRTFDFQKNT